MLPKCIAVLVLLSSVFAQNEQADRARAMGQLHTYDGKVVKLRRFCRDQTMNFDAAGELRCSSPGTSWTLDGIVRVSKADVRNGLLWLEGTRVYAIYNEPKKDFDYLPTDYKVKITAPVVGPVNESTLSAVMAQVLLHTGEPYPEPGTSYWRTFAGLPDPVVANAKSSLARIGGPVKAPKAIATPEPEYPKVAREQHYQATVVLWVVVGADGLVHDIAIKRPAGMGLDEKAIAAVQQWRFQPALKDGQPVAVQVTIEVNFRLYQ